MRLLIYKSVLFGWQASISRSTLYGFASLLKRIYFSCPRISMCKGVLSLNVLPARWRANAGQPVLPLRSGEEGAHCEIECFGVLAHVRAISCSHHIDDLLSALFATRIESQPHPLRIRYEASADPFTTLCECVGDPSWTPYKPVTNQLRTQSG